MTDIDNRVIRLRPIQVEDLETIMRWRMKPEVTDYLYTDPELSLDIQEKWFTSLEADKTVKYWIIEFEGIRIGLIWLLNIDYINQKTEFGWFSGELSYRGEGIFKRVLVGICEYVFEEMKFNKIYCEVFASNSHVIQNIYLKCGLVVEGILHEEILKRDKWHDVLRMGMLRKGWDKSNIEYRPYKLVIT